MLDLTKARNFVQWETYDDIRLRAHAMSMHVPQPDESFREPDKLWVKKQQTIMFPVPEDLNVASRFVLACVAHVAKLPKEDAWILWSVNPVFWTDHRSELSIWGGHTEHRLCYEWVTFAEQHGDSLRKRKDVRMIWPKWIEEQEWLPEVYLQDAKSGLDPTGISTT